MTEADLPQGNDDSYAGISKDARKCRQRITRPRKSCPTTVSAWNQ